MRLTKADKRLLIATVIKLATVTMFKNYFYGFGQKIFQQLEGGLRGTCSIARLVMQMFYQKWVQIMKGEGVELKLYF